ncbi:long-chain fatty acid transport protein 4-like [Nilaparvata lugens]|uniref:long-chain fatty acid transport protein 4-like n=1 Tax=Nilaparvata lugens TaxID=108931 RepID=UPI00193CC256|nr:long-chain fatty acid transport protein 4-like [Nilaparvata lugens]
MAAIADASGQVDLAALAEGLDKELPAYARPLFVRLLHAVEMTGTFKMKKGDLQKDGFDPAKVTDKLFYRKGSTYIPLTLDVFPKIVSGEERL